MNASPGTSTPVNTRAVIEAGPHYRPGIILDKEGGTGRGPVCDPSPVFKVVRQAGSSDVACSSGANV